MKNSYLAKGTVIQLISNNDKHISNGIKVEDLINKTDYKVTTAVYDKQRIAWMCGLFNPCTTSEIFVKAHGKAKVIKVILSDGSWFKCTPDFHIPMVDGSFRKASECLMNKVEMHSGVTYINPITGEDNLEHPRLVLMQTRYVYNIEECKEEEEVYEVILKNDFTFYIDTIPGIDAEDGHQLRDSSIILVGANKE